MSKSYRYGRSKRLNTSCSESMNENQNIFSNCAVAIDIKSKEFTDVSIFETNKYYNVLFISPNRAHRKPKSDKLSLTNTKVSKEQEEWIERLIEKDYEDNICHL